MLIQIPTDAEVNEFPSSTIWFGKDGILYSVGKPVEGERGMADIRREMEQLRKILGNRKVCIIIESNNRGSAIPREQRDAVAEELNSVTKAMAIVSSLPVSRMMANLFFSFKPPKYPMKLFSNVKDARDWIRQHL